MVANIKNIDIRLDRSQQRFLADRSAVKLGIWHRQKGKDFTTAGDAVLDAAENGSSWYIVSVTQRQANETFDKCLFWSRYLQQELRDKMRVEEGEPYQEKDVELGLLFTHYAKTLHLPNGGRVVSLPGRSPDTIAGFTGNVIFTELALFPYGGYEHWRVVFPLTTRGYRLVGITTPRGKDTKAHELFTDPDVSVHFCDIYQSVFEEGFPLYDKDNKPYPMNTRAEQEAALAAFRRRYNDEIGWQREYECKWMGALETLLKMSQLTAAATRGEGRPFDYLRIENESGWDPTFFDRMERMSGRPEIGWDVARHAHLSPLWINDGQDDIKSLRYLVVMHNCTFDLQRQVIRAAMDKNPKAVGNGDATGLGMESNETLEALYPKRWQGVDFGGTRKGEIASAIYTAFKDGTQALPGSSKAGGEHNFIAQDLYAIQKEGSAEEKHVEQAKSRLKLVETQNPLMPESHCDIGYAGGLSLRSSRIAPVSSFRSALI